MRLIAALMVAVLASPVHAQEQPVEGENVTVTGQRKMKCHVEMPTGSIIGQRRCTPAREGRDVMTERRLEGFRDYKQGARAICMRKMAQGGGCSIM
jgi:hypothetical protein